MLIDSVCVHCREAKPAKITYVNAVSRPSHCGDILFANSQQAYDELNDDIKIRLQGLTAVFCKSKLTNDAEECTVHPIVTTHPVTGKRNLYASPAHIVSIVGIEASTSDSLLSELLKHTTQNKYLYNQAYSEGDLVLWDNRGKGMLIFAYTI